MLLLERDVEGLKLYYVKYNKKKINSIKKLIIKIKST